MRKYKRGGIYLEMDQSILSEFYTATDLKPVVVSHAYSPSTREAKAGGS